MFAAKAPNGNVDHTFLTSIVDQRGVLRVQHLGVRYDPEDTIRFYALRLREAGMLKSSPAKIIADGADWRFLNEVRRELGG